MAPAIEGENPCVLTVGGRSGAHTGSGRRAGPGGGYRCCT